MYASTRGVGLGSPVYPAMKAYVQQLAVDVLGRKAHKAYMAEQRAQ